MLAWVLNTPLPFEDSLNVYFFKVFYIIRFLKSAISLKDFTPFNSSNVLLSIELLNHLTFLILFHWLEQKLLLTTC